MRFNPAAPKNPFQVPWEFPGPGNSRGWELDSFLDLFQDSFLDIFLDLFLDLFSGMEAWVQQGYLEKNSFLHFFLEFFRNSLLDFFLESWRGASSSGTGIGI